MVTKIGVAPSWMRRLSIAALTIATLVPTALKAQDPVAISPDVSVELIGITFEDQEVAIDDQAGFVSLAPLGALPKANDVGGYHVLINGDQLYTLEVMSDLGGGVFAGPADVIRFDGVSNTVEFDASAEGIPDGVVVDGVSVDASGNLVLSFDTTVDLGGLTAADEDAVQFDGLSFTMYFDGSAEGVAENLDVDGLEVLPGGDLFWVSFDGSGRVGGVDFDDEDILEFDSSGPAWSVVYDGSTSHTALAAADVVAVPEPSLWIQLVVGSGLILVLSGTRKERGRTQPQSRSDCGDLGARSLVAQGRIELPTP